MSNPWELEWHESGWTSEEGWEEWGKPFAARAQNKLLDWLEDFWDLDTTASVILDIPRSDWTRLQKALGRYGL